MHRIDRSERGFTVIELAIALAIIGLILATFLAVALSSGESTRARDTRATLETARDALIAFAARNDGCLPYAADFEGGLPDTNATGAAAAGYADTGIGVPPKQAGDLPWADLGLSRSFLDGDELRVQYYVASSYACDTSVTGLCKDKVEINKKVCKAGFVGFEWNPSVTYEGSKDNKLYVYFTPPGEDRQLYEIKGTLPAGNPPNVLVPQTTLSVAASKNDGEITVQDVTGFFIGDKILIELDDGTYHNTEVRDILPGNRIDLKKRMRGSAATGKPVGFEVVKVKNNLLPASLLEVRRGPDVTAAGSESDVVSAQNVFVLVAPGTNRNADVARPSVRDSNHVFDASGALWPLNDDGKDAVVFSATPNIDATDQGDNGDDTLLVMSFIEFKAALEKFGLNMEPLEN